MERLYGAPLTDLNAIRSVTTADPEQTLINALNTWVASVLYCETFHADVHAGNVLVMQVTHVTPLTLFFHTLLNVLQFDLSVFVLLLIARPLIHECVQFLCSFLQPKH
jgi:predicted unusual protein kinase regulating ubiquinone biosynthesis (AarF/ABC1/UbiB family)